MIKALIPEEIASGKVELRQIEGMTIENRAARLQSLPDDVFEEIKKCDVIIKGPMVTPRAGGSVAKSGISKQPAAPRSGAFCSRSSNPYSG